MDESSASTDSQPTLARHTSWRRWWRLALVLTAAFVIGFGLRHVGQRLEERERIAGFGQGLFQGAAMPLAFPTLVLGVDVTIYATNNNGVPYKLGYILGITGCGAFFFGAVYGRLARWRTKP
jgi:hypothetical protein